MNKKGILFIISAPSGSGKTTLCNRLAESMGKINRSISMTTRPPRAGEKDGIDYIFIQKEEFLKRFEKDGNTSKMEILERLEIKAPVDIKERIRSVNDKQKELIKERIQRIDDPEMIKILTPKLESRPILLQELKERDNNLRNMEQIQLKQKMRQTDIKRSDTVK